MKKVEKKLKILNKGFKKRVKKGEGSKKGKRFKNKVFEKQF